MKFKDYYQALGVERGATAEAIKKAYRKLAHKYHPDVSTDPRGEEKFKELAEAYATLKDPEKRQAYDDLGSRAAGEAFSPPPDWKQRFHTDDAGFEDVDLADLFAAFGRAQGGAQRRAAPPERGQDFEVSAPVSVEQLFKGGEIEVRAELPEVDATGLAHRVARSFRVTLPPGAADGFRLRLAGKGGPGINGGHVGDLYVALALQAHPLYRVSGRDLYIDLPLSPWEAALGAEVETPTPAGSVALKVKAGTSSGQKLRLAKRGLGAADGSIGALFAVVRIDVPTTPTPVELDLFGQLAAVSTFNPRAHFPSGASS
jgi:curved DNA-binding protein